MSARALFVFLLGIAGAAQAQTTITGTTSQVTTNAAPQLDPAISGDLVVYTDQRNGNDDVYYTDLSTHTEVQVTSTTPPQRLHDVSGNTIVYTDLTPPAARIFAYDVTTASAHAITSGADQNPRIDGQVVAFERGPTSNPDIVAVDLATSTEIPVATTGALEIAPSVSGTRVVYERHAFAGAPGDVVMFDLSTNSETLVAGSVADERRPDIDGDIVVYDVVSLTGDTDIAIYDVVKHTTTVLARPGDQTLAHVSGRFIAFDDNGAGNPDVTLYDMQSNTFVSVAADPNADFLNDIDGNRVVYTSNQSGNLDIWLFEFTVTDACTTPSTDLCTDDTGYSNVFSETFKRARGRPQVETRTFTAPAGPAVAVVTNHGCHAATATLNGETVQLPSRHVREHAHHRDGHGDHARHGDGDDHGHGDHDGDHDGDDHDGDDHDGDDGDHGGRGGGGGHGGHGGDDGCTTVPVELAANNTLSVRLRSEPGCSVDVSFEVLDTCDGTPGGGGGGGCASAGASQATIAALLCVLIFRRRRG